MGKDEQRGAFSHADSMQIQCGRDRPVGGRRRGEKAEREGFSGNHLELLPQKDPVANARPRSRERKSKATTNVLRSSNSQKL